MTTKFTGKRLLITLVSAGALTASGLEGVIDKSHAAFRNLTPKTSRGTPVVMPKDYTCPSYLGSDFDDDSNINGNKRMEPASSNPTDKSNLVLKKHRGVDLVAPYNTPVISAITGDVISIVEQSRNGKAVGIALGYFDSSGKYHRIKVNGEYVIERNYHLNEISVTMGQKVKIGETQIGTVGNSGTRQVAHLHKQYELGNRIQQMGSGYNSEHRVVSSSGGPSKLINPWDMLYNPTNSNPLTVPVLSGPQDVAKYAKAAEAGKAIFSFYCEPLVGKVTAK